MANPTGSPIRVTVHVVDGEPFMAEILALPGPRDTFVLFRNPRLRDGKVPSWLSPRVHSIVYSASQITFIELHDDTAADIFVRE
jgi:hypothetical protein